MSRGCALSTNASWSCLIQYRGRVAWFCFGPLEAATLYILDCAHFLCISRTLFKLQWVSAWVQGKTKKPPAWYFKGILYILVCACFLRNFAIFFAWPWVSAWARGKIKQQLGNYWGTLTKNDTVQQRSMHTACRLPPVRPPPNHPRWHSEIYTMLSTFNFVEQLRKLSFLWEALELFFYTGDR